MDETNGAEPADPAATVDTDTASPATILFVDDEQNVLQGIRRSTRGMRDRWDIHVADSGAAGLAKLEELGHIDVVVSDMRMPVMDGAEFLDLVRRRYPTTARIVLSGQADRESICRAIGPAHQYLAKPCDTEELIRIIDRIQASGFGTICEPVARIVGQVDRLPSPPELFTRINDLLGSEEWTLDELAALLEEDVAMTATIMKLVNSAFFGFYMRVETVTQAVSLLGVETVKGVVLGERLFEPKPTAADWLDSNVLGRRSRDVAYAARALVLRDGGPKSLAAEAFVTGIVNEIGLLVMASVDEVTSEVAERLNTIVDDAIEWAVFGGGRFQIGAHLLNLWGFSAEVVAAVAGQGTSTPIHDDGSLAWYLSAARHLVIDVDVDVELLADIDATVPGLDDALAALRDPATASAGDQPG